MNPRNINQRSNPPSDSKFANVSQAVNLRIRYEDMNLIRDAAAKMTLPMATFIRLAAVEKAKSVNATAVAAS